MQYQTLGLNPFDIRASVRTTPNPAHYLHSVSIPLISGHQSGLVKKLPKLLLSLNPFDIRASVRTPPEARHALPPRLNPFDIRASVRTSACACRASTVVSIPLISGHQSGQGPPQQRRADGVSIPLISGHQSGRTASATAKAVTGLNPFDIRASVRTANSELCKVFSTSQSL